MLKNVLLLMKFHCYSAPQIDTRGLVIKLEYFTILILALFGFIDTFPGGRVGGWSKIKIKDHLSPAETEIGAELGNFPIWRFDQF